MESEKQKNQRLYPEMFHIIDQNRAHVTCAAIIEDGEVVSGSMPGDDYKLAWIDADNYLAMPALKKSFDAAAKATPKSWVKRI